MTEQQLSQKLSNYIQINHPTFIYRFDYANDLKMTPFQVNKLKQLHGNKAKGYP